MFHRHSNVLYSLLASRNRCLPICRPIINEMLPNGPMISIEHIRTAVSTFTPVDIPQDSRTQTAVAMLLRQGGDGPELLFIERASHDGDPWSGNIAFPGGKLEDGDSSLQRAAERETLEELGIDLNRARFLGRLSDIIGANLPVRVACFVYELEEPQPVTVSSEVHDAFWVPLHILYDPERNRLRTVSFAGRSLEAPSIALPQPDKPLLWGITYRLVMQLAALVSAELLR